MTNEPTMPYILGETNKEIKVDTVEENIITTISLAQQARYSIDIFTQDLDTEIYSNKEFEQSIFKLAKKHPSTRIRILVQDSRKAVRNGHRLVRLAQTLTSSVFINNPSADHKNEQSSFMVVDQLGFIYRVSATDRNYRASINFMSPRRAAELSDFFSEMWEHSTADAETRRLYV
jgi:hypothetical protein